MSEQQTISKLLIDPIFDEGFKLTFGRENVSEPLLMDLLNSIFKDDPFFGNITSVTFTNTEHPNESRGGKSIRYDVQCITQAGHHYIVEMQKAHQTHFLERCQYYVGRSIATQGYKGRNEDSELWDFSLMPVVGVFICNFKVDELEAKPLVKGSLRDDESGKPIGQFQRYVFIQLPCFGKEELDCKTGIEQWIYNIKNMGVRQTIAFKTDNDIFRYLESVSNVAALDPYERDIYEACLMRARDYNATMKSARMTAMAEGRAEGRAEGLAEGREKEKYATARRMLARGLDFESVAEFTDLPVSVIENL